MKKIIACLQGDWVCLNDDPECVMGPHMTDPSTWYKEGAEIHSPLQKQRADTYEEMDYLKIHYKGVDYRINPIFIQIATSSSH
ncbi:MAG: hypothetical protein FWF59_06920 [Turicibacter sp.]|nr:hypothetical protein [Turicibacter sp.]